MKQAIEHNKSFWIVLKKLEKKVVFGLPIRYAINFEDLSSGIDLDPADEDTIIRSLIHKNILRETGEAEKIGTSIHYFLELNNDFYKIYSECKNIYEPETVSTDFLKKILLQPVIVDQTHTPDLNNQEIKIVEILEDKTELKKVTIYINNDYQTPRHFNRGINWHLMYQLAISQEVPYKKEFFDYFNSNKTNPLYATHGFSPTKF